MKSAFYCPKPLILLGFKLGNLADPKGFEPSIFSVTGRRVRPGYTTGPRLLVPGVGIEPTT